MSQILVVEPDRLLAQNICGAFSRVGHKVFCSADPQSAVSLADARKPDIIVLELLLAGRSGIELLYEMRSYTDWADIPAVIYSSLTPAEIGNDAALAHLGVQKIFYKPVTKISELVAEASRLAAPTIA